MHDIFIQTSSTVSGGSAPIPGVGSLVPVGSACPPGWEGNRPLEWNGHLTLCPMSMLLEALEDGGSLAEHWKGVLFLTTSSEPIPGPLPMGWPCWEVVISYS